MADAADAYKQMMANRKRNPQQSVPEREEIEPEKQAELPQPKNRKRGRPATGKRSDPGWIGRTYYVKEETDIDVEMELALLRRQGIEMDKSELVSSLLDAWVKWRQGENSESLLGEISPRRNSE